MKITTLAGAHISEWIKIVFALFALMIAVNELYLKDRDARVAQLENTKSFLLKGFDKEILDSVGSAIAHSRKSSISESEKWSVLISITPFHEYLLAWSSCVESSLCDRRTSVKSLCTRILGYEQMAERIFILLKMTYNQAERDKYYSGLLSTCQKSKE